MSALFRDNTMVTMTTYDVLEVKPTKLIKRQGKNKQINKMPPQVLIVFASFIVYKVMKTGFTFFVAV